MVVDDKKIPLDAWGLLVETVAGDDALEFPVLFPDDEGAELIDIYCIAFETVPKCPDLDPVLQRAGDALPFLDDRIVLPALDKEIPALELLEYACKERSTVDLMAHLGTDRGDPILQFR